jgi:dihydroxyacetone kinase-like protein
VFESGNTGALFSLLRERFDKKCEELNKLDAFVGDGDHGFTMSRAFRAAEISTQGHFKDIGEGFDAAAQAMAEYAGGAIGPLIAALFAEGGIVFSGKKFAGTREFIDFFKGGLQAIQDVGSAKVGEKTLVDALAPAVEAISQNADKDLVEALSIAAEAAYSGANATISMVAAHGRASFVADRSIGYQDAGATSLAIMLKAFHDFAQGKRASTFPEDLVQDYTPPPGKLINHPEDMISQDNEGLALAYPDLVKITPDGIIIRSTPKPMGKVTLVIGHGGGHTPSMGGFIGPGLLDADVYGPLFTCASGVRIAKAIELADKGAGVVLLVSNHGGDVLNARLAIRRARQIGIKVDPVLLGDDIATAPREKFQERRGLGGLLFALKVGGAAAELGKRFEEVLRLMKKTNERTATLAVSVKPPTHPATGSILFELPDNQIEVGTGVHGEVGVYRGPHMAADELVDMLVERLVEDLKPFYGNKFVMFINGTGGTSMMELHILYRRAHQNLTKRGIKVEAGVVNSFFTTLEMGGFSLSLCAVDNEILSYWNQPAAGPSFRWPIQ